MFELLFGIGILLVVLILFSLFRVGTLIGIVKGDTEKKVSGANRTNAIIFLLFFIFGMGWLIWYSVKEFHNYQVPIASEHGIVTDRLFWITMAITGIVFLITQFLLFTFPFKYQYKKERKALFYPDNNKLEVAWTVVPAIVLTGLILSGWRAWVNIMDDAPEEAVEIEVVGYQFAWAARYGGQDGKLGDYDFRLIDVDNRLGMDFTDRAAHDDFIPREIHVPVNRPVEFKIRALDVIHSVYSPHLRLQMNAVPGMPTSFWFVPNKTTAEMRAETGNEDFNYELVCNKICGKGHFAMRYIIVIDDEATYNDWYAAQDSWLSRNPEYLSKVPEDLQEYAMIASGIKNITD